MYVIHQLWWRIPLAKHGLVISLDDSITWRSPQRTSAEHTYTLQTKLRERWAWLSDYLASQTSSLELKKPHAMVSLLVCSMLACDFTYKRAPVCACANQIARSACCSGKTRWLPCLCVKKKKLSKRAYDADAERTGCFQCVLFPGCVGWRVIAIYNKPCASIVSDSVNW